MHNVYLQRAGRPAAADVKKTAGTITGRFSIKKADEEKHLAFGLGLCVPG